MAKREYPSKIYLIQAYSKTLNTTKQEFDEDALKSPYKHTVDARLAKLKAESLATRLNNIEHKGATDWVAKYPLMDYKPDGVTRGAQIISALARSRGAR
jgi:hypothetical protein